MKELDFRRRYGLSVVALNRMQRSYRTDVGDLELNFGDTLLVVGSSPQLGSLRRSADFIVIEPNWSDQPVNQKEATLAVIIVLAGIVASIAGVPVYLAMLASAVLAILVGKLSMEDAYRSVEWQAIFLIAGMYVVSDAMVETRLADLLGKLSASISETIRCAGTGSRRVSSDFHFDSNHWRAGDCPDNRADYDQRRDSDWR